MKIQIWHEDKAIVKIENLLVTKESPNILSFSTVFSNSLCNINKPAFLNIFFLPSHGSLEADSVINEQLISDLPVAERSKFSARHCLLRHRLGKTGP